MAHTKACDLFELEYTYDRMEMYQMLKKRLNYPNLIKILVTYLMVGLFEAKFTCGCFADETSIIFHFPEGEKKTSEKKGFVFSVFRIKIDFNLKIYFRFKVIHINPLFNNNKKNCCTGVLQCFLRKYFNILYNIIKQNSKFS